MPRSPDKKPAGSGGKDKAPADTGPKPLPNPDLPDPESIIDEISFTSPKGHTYRILVTDELDAYEEPKQKRSRKKRRD